MAAPSVVQSAGKAAGSGNAAFTLGAGPTAGNILLAFVGYNSSFTLTPPAGWTKVFDANNSSSGNNEGLACYWHLVAGGDGTSYTFTVTGDFTSGEMYEITGADTTTPVNGSATGGDGTSPSSRTTPGVTPSVLNCLPLAAETDNNGVGIASVTAGWTLLAETGNFHGGGAAYGPATSSTITAVSCTFNYTGGSSPATYGTVVIQPPQGAPSVHAPTPPQIPTPLFWDLLEVAEYRADVAPAVASLQRQHWRLMDGVNGRPGTGSSGTQPPATATGSGNNVNGTSFYVTQSGMWLEGYWWFVCAAGGQSTSPQKFALWSVTSGSTGTLVSGSTVTSGTLSTGWNWVPLARPVQLALYGYYTAETAVSGTYPDTANQFGSGDPYAGGITSGPLVAFSDVGGSNPPPYSYGNGVSAAGTDPSQVLATGTPAAHDNFWIDVQVTNTPPAGYNGSYRLWPNMADGYASSADAAVNYVIGTEVILSQACVVNAVWYYFPGGGSVQFATSADIWRVRDGVRVATQPHPVWTDWSGAPATAGGSGRWLRCELPGTVTLPAGDYRVSIYNSAGTPDQWSAKRLGYWQAYGQAPDGTYQHMPPGANGITNGPLYAPTTPLASSATDYNTPSVTEPGQSVFQSGPPNQFPDLYVGTPANLFQNYWVDLEVTPAALYQPDAPTPPRVWSPYWEQHLEAAWQRIENGAPQGGNPVTASAGLATAVGAAPGPVPQVTVQAGVATAAGNALSPVPQDTALAGLASGTGTALAPVPQVTPAPGLATGIGVSSGPDPQVGAGGGLAGGSGTASGPVPQDTALAGLATGTGTAQNPTVSTSSNVTANAGLATATGNALSPVPGVTPAAGQGTASGTAAGPGVTVAAGTGLAQGSGTASGPGSEIDVTTGLAQGAGTSLPPVPQVTVLAGLASAAGTAQNPAISGTGIANAGLAAGAGAAPGPVPQVTVNAGLATAAGAAPGLAATIAALAGQAAATATALAPLAAVEALAGLAAATGTVQNPSIPLPGNITASAGLATAAAAALTATAVLYEPPLYSLGTPFTLWDTATTFGTTHAGEPFITGSGG